MAVTKIERNCKNWLEATGLLLDSRSPDPSVFTMFKNYWVRIMLMGHAMDGARA